MERRHVGTLKGILFLKFVRAKKTKIVGKEVHSISIQSIIHLVNAKL